uniref:YfiR family protein n=1 Tax=Roseihalotalea indica TaxID=2867963 RepID=A0AA49Q0M4_9BACT|nr:YfiR family protein [Tunicatimonas sp. TK19036]
MIQRRILVLLFVLLWGWLEVTQPLYAQTTEDKMKAVFLYSFTKYVDWSHSDDQIVIGVYGNNTVLNILQKDMKGKKVQGKDVVAKSITTPSEVQSCQVVYLPKSNSSQLSEVVSTSAKQGILVVTEENLAAQGAGISFTKQSSKLGFVLNKKVLEANQLKVMTALYNMGKVL